MPSIQKRIGKRGISYKITVSSGTTVNAKQIRHYMTYKPPKTMKEARADKEAIKEALLFEEKINQGYQPDCRITFEEYSQQFLKLKLRSGIKQTTYEQYIMLLRRILPAIGHMKLQNIRPNTLNAFYDQLMEAGTRYQQPSGILQQDLDVLLKERHISQAELSWESGVSQSTIHSLRVGHCIRWENAVAISKALGPAPESLFQKEMHSEPLASKSIYEHHALIRAILGQAEKELLVPYNAATRATPPRIQHSDVTTLEPEEISAILKALEEEPLKWRCLIHLLIVTGCRRGEIAGLKWENVDINQRLIFICETLLPCNNGTIVSSPKTSNSTRYINLPRESVDLLQEYQQEQSKQRNLVGNLWYETGYVFTRDDGLPIYPHSINTWLDSFCKRHGFRHINPHAFRHSLASILINQGTDILSVSRRLGHSNATTTLNIYGHVLRQADACTTDCIANVLLKK